MFWLQPLKKTTKPAYVDVVLLFSVILNLFKQNFHIKINKSGRILQKYRNLFVEVTKLLKYLNVFEILIFKPINERSEVTLSFWHTYQIQLKLIKIQQTISPDSRLLMHRDGFCSQRNSAVFRYVDMCCKINKIYLLKRRKQF